MRQTWRAGDPRRRMCHARQWLGSDRHAKHLCCFGAHQHCQLKSEARSCFWPRPHAWANCCFALRQRGQNLSSALFDPPHGEGRQCLWPDSRSSRMYRMPEQCLTISADQRDAARLWSGRLENSWGVTHWRWMGAGLWLWALGGRRALGSRLVCFSHWRHVGAGGGESETCKRPRRRQPA